MDIIVLCPLKRQCEEKIHYSLQPYYRIPSFVKQIHPKRFFCFFGTPSQKRKAKILLKKSSTRKKNSICNLLCKSLVIVILEYPFLRYCTIIHVPYRSLNKK